MLSHLIDSAVILRRDMVKYYEKLKAGTTEVTFEIQLDSEIEYDLKAKVKRMRALIEQVNILVDSAQRNFKQILLKLTNQHISGTMQTGE